MSKKNKHKKLKGQNMNPKFEDKINVPLPLQLLAQKRFGGAINLRGIYFQLLFAIHTAIDRLKEPAESCRIWMEGAEDIDVYISDQSHLFQIKTSQNTLDASTIWNMKVLQHFWEAYRLTPALSFCLIHNSTIAKGRLQDLEGHDLNEDTLKYWYGKFNDDNISVTSEDLKVFLYRVTFKSINEQDLYQLIRKNLIEVFGINLGTEHTFLQALFYWVFESSKNRSLIGSKDLADLIDSVKQSFSKFPVNPALQHNWISAVTYQIPDREIELGYYDGKAARPVDIVRQLPVRRLEWEKTILASLEKFDVTVIRSSSGQGKSTLAWQIGYELQKSNFSIYQLHYCKEYNEVNAINDFINSRLSVGQMPVVVIDGLNQHLAGWSSLAKLLRDKPVKLIITTRQEDWIRYNEEGADIIFNIIEIKLNIHEAKLIYDEIVRNNKLHPSATTWEPVWERVKERGLMIEYIFLLTRGQMMEERLQQQINILKSEEGNAAKLEILRLISLADLLIIKVATQRLTQHIQEVVGFKCDRNETYRQLEKEYYLKFDNSYVEGLHPVRSEHLVKILHSHIPVNDSLINLLKIIDESYIYDYFINAPLVFDATQDDLFFKQAAEVMATKTTPEMVYAIDGLMHLEPYRYWNENKTIFDAVSTKGGMDIFIYDTAPFAKLQTIQGLSVSLTGAGKSNANFLLQKQAELSHYTINNSSLVRFSSFLGNELNKRASLSGFEGLTFLYKWFRKLNITFPDIIKIDETVLLKFLETKDIGETADIFHFYNILNPFAYSVFISKHKSFVMGWIKKKTNTVTIYEEDNHIHINYLLDKNHDKAYEYSVYRLNIVHSFMPYFQHYCTQAIVLPFPNSNIFKPIVDNSTKNVSPEAIVLGDNFDVHINQIWAKTIFDQYSANSTYEWQKQYIDLRVHCANFYKYCTRLIEAVLEQNVKQQISLSQKVASHATDFFSKEFALKKFPSNSKKYFDKQMHDEHLSKITNWLSSLQNFINQLSGLLNSQNDRDRNLPLINIRAATYRLPLMQIAYDHITNHSYTYFKTEQLCIDENKWLKRLYHTVQFFIKETGIGKSQSSIIAAARTIQEWKIADQKKKLELLRSIISKYGSHTNYKFYLPANILEDEDLNYAVIGIQGFNILNEDELWDLSWNLSKLCRTEIHFFTFVIVNEKNEATGAFRASYQYFEQFEDLQNGIEVDASDRINLLPIIPDEPMLQTLEGVKLQKAISIPANDSFFRMMFNIWKLIEHRERLDPQNIIEQSWLIEVESEYSQAILNDLPTAILNDEASPISAELVRMVINKEKSYTVEEICSIMMKKAIQMQSAEQKDAIN